MSTSAPLRLPLAIAVQRAKLLLDVVAGFVDRVEIAGSIRRRSPTCGDVDLNFARIRTKAAAVPAPVAPVAPPRARPGTSKGKGTGKGAGKGKAGPC